MADIDLGGARTIYQLNDALKKSFGSIKEDMGSIKEALEMHVHSTSSSTSALSKEIDGMKKDFVTSDKVNAIRIKIGDLNESIKRLDEMHKRLGDVHKKLDETQKAISSLSASAVKKGAIESMVEDIRNELAIISKAGQKAVPKPKMDRLVKEVNVEFDNIRNEISSLSEKFSEKGGKIIEKKLTAFTKKFEDNIDKLKKDVLGYRADISKNVKAKQVENLIEDVNAEFNELRKDIERMRFSVESNANEMKSLKDRFIRKREFGEKLKELSDDIKSVLAHVCEIKKKVKLSDDNEERMKYLRRELKRLEKKTGKTLAKGRGFGLLGFANIIVALSFISLAGSFVTYFFYYGSWTNGLLGLAVALFVIGIICRVVGILRR